MRAHGEYSGYESCGGFSVSALFQFDQTKKSWSSTSGHSRPTHGFRSAIGHWQCAVAALRAWREFRFFLKSAATTKKRRPWFSIKFPIENPAFWGLQNTHKNRCFFALKRREGWVLHAFRPQFTINPAFSIKSELLHQVSHIGRSK